MKIPRTLAGLLGMAALLHAHPMGNFSVNHYARLAVAPDGVHLLFVLDLAEIPTFELMQKWGVAAGVPQAQLEAKATGEARAWVRQLKISVDDKPVVPLFEGASVTVADGAGNLPVMQVRSRLKILAPGGKLEYEDRTYPDRTAGWKEIVAAAEPGATIQKTTADAQDRSQALTAYPQDATVAPPQDLKASLTWTGSPRSLSKLTSPAAPVRPVPPPVPPQVPVPEALPAPSAPVVRTAPTVAEPNSMGQVTRGDYLSRALQGREFGWGLGILCVAVAFWFGALHALEPGHGKTMVAAYLVGSRGTPKHAIFLGGMVTFTHTVSVFFLGLITLFLSRYIMADLLSKILGVISGLTIVWIGGMLLYQRVHTLSYQASQAHGHDHPHGHSHLHAHPHDHELAYATASQSPSHLHTHAGGGTTHTHDGQTHSHVPAGAISLKSLMVLGISGGLVPCPSALVLLLSAITIGRTGFGLLLLLSFSLGLALVLMATGLLVLYAKNLFPQRKSANPSPFFRIMPIVSAAVILVIGIVLTGNATGLIPVIRFFG